MDSSLMCVMNGKVYIGAFNVRKMGLENLAPITKTTLIEVLI